MFHFISI